jgi:hypothetical protein
MSELQLIPHPQWSTQRTLKIYAGQHCKWYGIGGSIQVKIVCYVDHLWDHEAKRQQVLKYLDYQKQEEEGALKTCNLSHTWKPNPVLWGRKLV